MALLILFAVLSRSRYATIGDLFVWLRIAGLVVLIGVALARRRTDGETSAAAPREEPLSVS
jgi:hypothetical protein